MTSSTQFDRFAEEYDDALNEGLSITGEAKDYFARVRVLHLKRLLQKLSFLPGRVMDYGCGTGFASHLINTILRPRLTVGVDTSERSLEVARRSYAGPIRFVLTTDYRPQGDMDLVYCNGVFHHIHPASRATAISYVLRCLRPGGLFAFWENNPWNPGTRYVMSRIPFDRDAITLPHTDARALLREGGFEILHTDFLFFFPNWLKPLRALEPALRAIPLGGQYQVLSRKGTV